MADAEIISRHEAKQLGRRHYFTGRPCHAGHIAARYVVSRACVPCHAAHWPEYGKRESSREAKRQRARLYRYGLSNEKYQAILKAQNGVCAICGCWPEGKGLAVDHCHITGIVRGLLCPSCNWAVGLMGNDGVKARKMGAYLDHWQVEGK